MLEAWEDRAVPGDSQKARLNAGNTKYPPWQPCDVMSVKNVSAQRYMGEGTRKVVKYENLAEHSTEQAHLDPGGRQGSVVHRQHVYYQNQALAGTRKCPICLLFVCWIHKTLYI